ncbi:unnamed protein product [Calicophoron daubneyi]|uniref:Phospholipid scramblase n=1 Tax=Calicophoron daubneyi TaxID=300641 RepID=A0AAV2SWD1_CALDB
MDQTAGRTAPYTLPGYPQPQTGYPPPQGVGYPPPSEYLPQGAYPPPGFQEGYAAPQAGYGPPPPGYTPQYGPYAPSMPLASQVNWMVAPTGANCPLGLEYLTQIDQLLIKQKIEMLEVMVNVETENKYVCLNTMGQTVYKCSEESDFCARQCCKSRRGFTMHVEDHAGMEVIRVIRPFKCQLCCECCSCSDCCQDELEVQAPIGTAVGYVKQICDGCTIKYAVRNAKREDVLQIEGPSYCSCRCFGDVRFKIYSVDGSVEIGRITKQWSNILQEYFTDADNFGICFPMDLDVNIKAVLIGAVFLIDFMFFEDNQANNNNDHHHGGFYP